MKFNAKTRYGLRTMLELALHSDGDEGVFQKDISENQAVSIKYLDQIIAALKKAGLVVNVGGKKSGYKLGRPAAEISVYDIYRAFEDDLAIIECLITNYHCPGKKHCVMKDYWCDLNDSIRANMESMNLEKLTLQHVEANLL